MIILRKSPKRTKKWRVEIHGRVVDFGARGYSDYTMHKNHERMLRYIQRHQKREDWKNPYTAGYWSRWLLWSKPSFAQALQNLRKKLGPIKLDRS
jgi:hypothetical protein